MSPQASIMTGVRGERIALSDVSVSATLRDLLGEVTVCQTYRNDEDVNIEAVYTFPLPLDAVLLDLRVEIGGRTLNGIVVEKKAAEEKYEDAVADGDAAVMLEAIEPGLYTMNVGNLLPKETATITFVYAIVYRWVGDTLRVSLPTTIAPRYGASPHAPHQTPESSLAVENQFSLQVDVVGSLREAVECPPCGDVGLVRRADRDHAHASEGGDGSRLRPDGEGPAGDPQLRDLRRGRRRSGGDRELQAAVSRLAAASRARTGDRDRLLGVDAGRFDRAGQAGARRHPRRAAAARPRDGGRVRQRDQAAIRSASSVHAGQPRKGQTVRG